MPRVVLKDYYVVLGIDRGATADELKKRYRKLARQTHPDCLGPDAAKEAIAEANELFKELGQAYGQLSDPETRQAIDAWLAGQGSGADWFGFGASYSAPQTVTVPPAGEYSLSGIPCWVEFRDLGHYGLRATVKIQLDDLFTVVDLGPLPHGAWLSEIIAVDERGDAVGHGYSLMSLRYDIRRLRAEARRNEARREWRARLAVLERQIDALAGQHKPVERLQALLIRADHLVESGVYIRDAAHPDTVVRAIRELEKEIERVTASDAEELLLDDLMSGAIKHPDLAHNKALLRKLRVYAFRSGGEYQAPTDEDVRAHYRVRLSGLTTQRQVHHTSLRLTDDEPTILELAAEGVIELAPDSIQIQGNRGLVTYPVEYGYSKVGGEQMPAGMVVVPWTAYEKNGAQYGKASQFPALPHGIQLLIRVRVRVQDCTMLSDPCPDGKPLQNEVRRCQARLRNPNPPQETAMSFVSLWALPGF